MAKQPVPPRKTKAAAAASGWKPPFPGALPPFQKAPGAKPKTAKKAAPKKGSK